MTSSILAFTRVLQRDTKESAIWLKGALKEDTSALHYWIGAYKHRRRPPCYFHSGTSDIRPQRQVLSIYRTTDRAETENTTST